MERTLIATDRPDHASTAAARAADIALGCGADVLGSMLEPTTASTIAADCGGSL